MRNRVDVGPQERKPFPITGRCHCGHVSYEAQIDRNSVSICHCNDCQRLTGSAFRVTATAIASDFRLTGAAPKTYLKLGDNGKKRYQCFCPECGSPIYTTGEGDEAEVVGIRVGTIDQRQELYPVAQIWTASRLGWLSGISDLPQRARD